MKAKSEISYREKRAELTNGPITIKHLASDANWASPKAKRKKISGPVEIVALVSPKAK